MGRYGTHGNLGRGAGLMAACCALVVGCGDSGVKVDNDNPLGTVGGLVVDGVSELPLDGVAVKLLSGGGTFDTTTGSDGFYKLADVPAGSFTIELTKDGYLPIRVQNALSGSVGNFPISSPVTTVTPYGLVPIGPDFVVRVVDANGVAVNGATATARLPFSFVNLQSGTPQFQGSVASTATTGADGRLVFKGLPDVQKLGPLVGTYTYDPTTGYITADTAAITIAPIAIDGQDGYQYAGGIFTFRLLYPGVTIPEIVLPGPTDALRVLESNLEWLRDGFTLPSPAAPINGSIIDTAGPITIAFSEAIDPTTLRAQVTTESGQPGPMLTPTVNLNLVSFSGSFAAGQRYDLYLEATALLNPAGPGRQRNATVPFFGKPAMGSKPTVVTAKIAAIAPATTPPTYQVVFTLSEPIGVGDGGTQAFDCVMFFEGANFDGSGAGAANVLGEWSTDANALSCSTATAVAGVQPAATTNNGHVNGFENVGNINAPPLTGFVSTFASTPIGAYVQTAMPTMAAAGSVVPAATTKGHLYFTNTGRTVRRADGEPITDIPFTLQ